MSLRMGRMEAIAAVLQGSEATPERQRNRVIPTRSPAMITNTVSAVRLGAMEFRSPLGHTSCGQMLYWTSSLIVSLDSGTRMAEKTSSIEFKNGNESPPTKMNRKLLNNPMNPPRLRHSESSAVAPSARLKALNGSIKLRLETNIWTRIDSIVARRIGMRDTRR